MDKIRIDKLIEEEMGSGIEVEWKNFKVVVEKFTEYIESITLEIENSVKICQ